MTVEISEKFRRALGVHANPGHDYPEDFKYENGMYMSICIDDACKQKFTGGKYRFLCKVCSDKRKGQAVGQGLN